MTHLNQLLRNILARETAAVGEPDDRPIPIDAQMEYLQMALTRADALLDRRRDRVFFEVMNIPDKNTAHRVAATYDATYLLGLGLSLDATVELVRELIGVMRTMNVRYPNSWDALAQGILVGVDDPEPLETPTIREKVIK